MPPPTSHRVQHAVLPQIKVCGITRVIDLESLKRCGVDAVGFNLVRSSKRFIELDSAINLAARAAELGIATVAVVMDPTESELAHICASFSWSFIQLHGHEAAETAGACGGIAIIKAASWSGRSEERLLVESWSTQFGGALDSPQNIDDQGRCRLAGFLLDAYAPGQGGGTGLKARWDLVYPRPELLVNWPVMLAGGLTADNVFSAIQATRCNGVDVASGVESAPGKKAEELVKRFASAAHAALQSVELDLRF